jgi:hypothetical protein
MKKCTLLLQFIVLSAFAETTTAVVHDDTWRAQELRRARPFIRQHDFAPIDEAFAAKDIKLLWHYYIGSYQLNFQLYHRITAERLKDAEEKLKNEPQELAGMKLAFERSQYAGRYLQQIPGHARLIGDMIEETLYRRAGGGGMRRSYFECLWRLGQEGSDECIEQLGRYLFDLRDPGFRPLDPAFPKLSPYDTRGVPNTVQSNAIGSMMAVIRPRFHVGESWVDERKLPMKGYEEKVQNWWLTSEQAAPYRRSLAATGAVLPPGYPPMKELEGTKTTIAPPLKNPPYPDGESAPVETPPPGSLRGPTSEKQQ